jgi:N6-L-threonylcarbamoyladenine synthase
VKSAENFITLGIESSCDDTSIAVLRGEREVLSMAKKSQVDLHRDFGGVVPEIAARGHTDSIFGVLETALRDADIELQDLDLIAATCGPGLVGSLLVGITLGKALALRTHKPFVAVHHLEAHLSANFLEYEDLQFPMIGLLISGGHSCLYHLVQPGQYEILGESRDDAVGELYDKVARELGLSQPGGPAVDRLVQSSDADPVKFTPPLLHSEDFDFSFSGLKTACLRAIAAKNPRDGIAKGMQNAVIEVLVAKTLRALETKGCKTLVVAGGVSANRGLRDAFAKECEIRQVRFARPSIPLCTDNGAMVARSGYDRYKWGYRSSLEVDAFSRMPLQTLLEGGLWES